MLLCAADKDLNLAPQGPIQPSVCTPITHLYFCPSYWHLGHVGLWQTSNANAAATSLQHANDASQVRCHSDSVHYDERHAQLMLITVLTLFLLGGIQTYYDGFFSEVLLLSASLRIMGTCRSSLLMQRSAFKAASRRGLAGVQ